MPYAVIRPWRSLHYSSHYQLLWVSQWHSEKNTMFSLEFNLVSKTLPCMWMSQEKKCNQAIKYKVIIIVWNLTISQCFKYFFRVCVYSNRHFRYTHNYKKSSATNMALCMSDFTTDKCIFMHDIKHKEDTNLQRKVK